MALLGGYDKNGDYAFLLHILASLKSNGKGAVILPHGVLFRGNAEADIRREVVRRGYIKGIIGLPANLFYGTGIPACIIVLDKENADTRKSIFMTDASKGFIKDGNKNRLRAQDIHKIVDAFNKQIEIAKYARVVPLSEIEANDYNLNIPRYIDSTEAEDLQDIAAHLQGGIPNQDIDSLSQYWQVFPSLRNMLFTSSDRSGYSMPKVEANDVKAAIFGHSEFSAYRTTIEQLFTDWKTANAARLMSIVIGEHAKALIEALSESLLETFRKAELFNPYAVYQHLMNYWVETMQDDVYLLVQEGWKAVVDGKPNTDLIPQSLMIRRYFATEASAIEQAEIERDAITREMEKFDEEHGGEEGLLSDAKTDKDNLTKASVKKRLTEIKNDRESADERKLLNKYLELIEKEATASKKMKDLQKSLDEQVFAKYAKLTESEIKALVVNDKWLATLATDVQTELDRVSQALAGRIKQLAERYATPLPKLTAEVITLETKVNEHLKKMGFVWQVPCAKVEGE